jgi:hypothetical protein
MMRRFTHRNDEIANIEERPGFSVNGETRTLFFKSKNRDATSKNPEFKEIVKNGKLKYIPCGRRGGSSYEHQSRKNVDFPCYRYLCRRRPFCGCGAFFPAGAEMAAVYRRISPGRHCRIRAASHLL